MLTTLEIIVLELKPLFSASYDFTYIEAMKVILFSKYSKFYVDFQNAIKFPKKVNAV